MSILIAFCTPFVVCSIIVTLILPPPLYSFVLELQLLIASLPLDSTLDIL